MVDLKILSYNTQGLQTLQKRVDVFEYLKDKKSQIYCLQDTHFIKENEANIIDQWGNSNCILSNYKTNSRGVAILFGKDLDYKIHRKLIDENGNYIIIDITATSKRFTLVNLYGPNVDDPNFFQNIFDYIEDIGNSDIIICGDYNCVLDPDLDYYNYKTVNNAKARDKILELMSTKYLQDPFREMNPEQKKFTWRKKNPCKQARLDFFLISEELMQLAKKCSIEPSYRSDHSIITLELNLTDFTHGKSYWKHNNSLLSDPDYLVRINNKIVDIKRQYALPVYNIEEIDRIPNEDIQFTIDDQLFLDTLLMELRGESISFSSYKNKQINQREKELIKNINDLENCVDESNMEQIEILKTELCDIRNYKMKGHMIRSKAKYIDQGEKPTKYFCGLEKHNYVSKVISKIVKDDDTVLTDQSDILKETESFYKKLYENKDDTLENINIEEYMQNTEMNKLSEQEAINLEGPLTFKEISDSLYKMKHGKSPGMSGFTAEFFKVFWRQIGIFVLRSLNLGYRNGELSICQRQGIITCIPKENKSKHYLKNWRPLTLLDSVYKIASGAIANRLKVVLDNIINKDQTGFVKGRYIGENTRLIYDLMNHTEQNNIPGLLLLIDFEKAFDSLSWSFIFKAMKYLNFGESFIGWIKAFYNNISSAVIQCGYLSTFFNIGRGCRQGDPLSPYLFILCAEFLSSVIRQNKKIKGIFVEDTEFKISQFADDTSMFLDGSSDSLNTTLHELERFARISGLKINFDKTQVVWIGFKKYSSETIKTKWKLSWGCQRFKILGINFNVDLEKMESENYNSKVHQLENMVKLWGKRSLTPLGKITIIKTFMISVFNHLFLMLPNPSQNIIQHINNVIFNFLWNNKPSKIKASTIQKQYCEGGLKMINLNAFIQALKSTWIRRLLHTDNKWQIFIKAHVDISKLTGCNMIFIQNMIGTLENKFWKDVLQSLININKNSELNESDILKSPIFYNNSIKIGGTHIFYREWFNKGIMYVNDLINEKGDFYTETEFSYKTGIRTNFLQYNGLIKTIKNYLKYMHLEITHKEQCPFIPSHISTLLKQNKGSKAMYNTLNKSLDKPTGQGTWNKIFKITNEEWRKIYSFPFIVTKYPALQWYQISINHNILVTNKLLNQMKIRNDALCTLCMTNNETITHLLWSCCKTQQFINDMTNWLNTFNICCNLTEEYFIFGLQREQGVDKVLHFIFLYAKYYIYLARCKNQKLYIRVFQMKLEVMYRVHREIAYANQEEDTFKMDWSPYLELIDSIS